MKATLIYATGRIEEAVVPDDQGAIERIERVTHMHDPKGHQLDVYRRFERHHVANANTLKDGQPTEGAWGPLNDGFVVFLETRPVKDIGSDPALPVAADADKTGELAVVSDRETPAEPKKKGWFG